MKNLFIISSILILCACKQEIEYKGLTLPKKTLKGEILNDSFLFSWPEDMIIVDSLLVIHDSFKQNFCFHIFNRNTGKHLKSFGEKGRGPGEVIFPESLNYDSTRHKITTFEPNLKKIISYDINNVLTNTSPEFSEITVSTTYNLFQAIPHSNTFLLRGNDSQMRFGQLNADSKITALYSDYPKVTPDVEENRAIFNYTPKWDIKPDNTKMVCATYIGSIIEIFDITRNSIHLSTVKYLYKPIFTSLAGFSPKWIGKTKETIIGTDNLYCTNNYIYMIFQGETNKNNIENRKIITFDWDGKACLQYELPEATPLSIAIDEKEKIMYCIATNQNDEYVLYKVELNGIKL